MYKIKRPAAAATPDEMTAHPLLRRGGRVFDKEIFGRGG
jgi:hypothetical protein